MENKFTHQSPVVKVELKRHPNSDFLSTVCLYDGLNQVVVNTADWQGVEYGIWIQPQSLVDTNRPEFSFLKRDGESNIVRIKPIKLRGIMSNGLLIPTTCNEVGKDMSTELGVEHWEPEESLSTGGQYENCGRYNNLSKYDIDSIHKIRNHFVDGETVHVTEKIHGANCRVFHDGSNFHVGTRNHWILEFDKSVHWRAFHSLSDGAKQFLIEHPFYVLYGEATGDVKGFKYGCAGGDRLFLTFDIMQPNHQYMCVDRFSEITKQYNIKTVPYIGQYPFNYDELKKLATGKSLVDGVTLREGIVVRPLVERQSSKFERLIFKIINEEFK